MHWKYRIALKIIPWKMWPGNFVVLSNNFDEELPDEYLKTIKFTLLIWSLFDIGEAIQTENVSTFALFILLVILMRFHYLINELKMFHCDFLLIDDGNEYAGFVLMKKINSKFQIKWLDNFHIYMHQFPSPWCIMGYHHISQQINEQNDKMYPWVGNQ